MAENYITKHVEKGTINISEDVIAVMVSAAVTEVEGVAGFGSATTPELVELFGRKTNTKQSFDRRSHCAAGVQNYDARLQNVAEWQALPFPSDRSRYR